MLPFTIRARLVMISLFAFTACGPPAATDTGETDTQSESTTDTGGTTDGGVAGPLADRCDPSVDDPCAARCS
jgi:hypothetical protein